MIENLIREGILSCLEAYGIFEEEIEVVVEKPREREHGDLSTSIALSLAKRLGRKPRELAGEIAAGLNFAHDVVESVEIAGPGFINFRLARPFQITRLLDLWQGEGERAAIRTEAGRRINVEYISANPTGPLNIVSARAGAFGAALVRLLDAIGYDAHSEYYVNDAGTQMRIFAETLYRRYLQALGHDAPLDKQHYQGAYMVDLAHEIVAECGDRFRDLPEELVSGENVGNLGRESGERNRGQEEAGHQKCVPHDGGILSHWISVRQLCLTN
jgi:arginyl-tRNA synthetase